MYSKARRLAQLWRPDRPFRPPNPRPFGRSTWMASLAPESLRGGGLDIDATPGNVVPA